MVQASTNCQIQALIDIVRNKNLRVSNVNATAFVKSGHVFTKRVDIEEPTVDGRGPLLVFPRSVTRRCNKTSSLVENVPSINRVRSTNLRVSSRSCCNCMKRPTNETEARLNHQENSFNEHRKIEGVIAGIVDYALTPTWFSATT